MPGAFRDIQFGFADAQKEGAEAPDLLLHGFLDRAGLIDEALGGSAFLILGYKGSGKTAIAQRARLLAADDPELFVTAVALDDFSYVEFNRFAGAPADPESRYPAAWTWLLLLSLIHSLEGEEAGCAAASGEFRQLCASLRARGLLPVVDLKKLVLKSSKRTVRAMIPKLAEVSSERSFESQDVELFGIAQVLRDAVLAFPTSSRHVVFVDGLDEVLAEPHLQSRVLATLMSETARINAAFAGEGKPFKIVILCRTDLFDRLPGANKNKIRQDSSVVLDWFDDPADPDRTRLVQLVNLRASRSLGRDTKVFDEFLPPRVDDRPVRRYLLDHTRHLPRDVLQLLKSMQRFADDAEPTRLTEPQVKSAIRAYSNGYFLPELRDELHGYLDPAQVDDFVVALTSLGRSRFTMQELELGAAKLGLASASLRNVMDVLFECSGVGMRDQGGGGPRYTFKYRNRAARLLPDREIVVHLGAHKALNLETGSGAPAARRRRGRRRPHAPP